MDPKSYKLMQADWVFFLFVDSVLISLCNSVILYLFIQTNPLPGQMEDFGLSAFMYRRQMP